MFRILSSEKIAPKEYDFWVEAPRIAEHTLPGQFVVLRASEYCERIPLTITDFDIICDFCPSIRDFAFGFIQIPPHDGHPCRSVNIPTAKPVVDFQHRVIAHAGLTEEKPACYTPARFLHFG